MFSKKPGVQFGCTVISVEDVFRKLREWEQRRLPAAWLTGDNEHRRDGHLPAEIAVRSFSPSGGNFFEKYVSFGIEETPATQFVTFRANLGVANRKHLLF